MDNSVQIQSGTHREDDRDTLMRLFDEAVLQVTAETVHRRLAESSPGSALIAYDSDKTQIVGACLIVPDKKDDRPSSDDKPCSSSAQQRPTELTHIAVTHSRQASGIGSQLVMAAVTATPGPLVAQFHQSVRPFYVTLGFDIAPVFPDTKKLDVNNISDDTEGRTNVPASVYANNSASSNTSSYYRGTLR